MDNLEQYRKIIERELTAIVEQTKQAISAPPGLRDKTVFDRQSDYYLILREGWDGSRRIHGPVVSLEIIDGKVWLQADNTDLRVAERLCPFGKMALAQALLGPTPFCRRDPRERSGSAVSRVGRQLSQECGRAIFSSMIRLRISTRNVCSRSSTRWDSVATVSPA